MRTFKGANLTFIHSSDYKGDIKIANNGADPGCSGTVDDLISFVADFKRRQVSVFDDDYSPIEHDYRLLNIDNPNKPSPEENNDNAFGEYLADSESEEVNDEIHNLCKTAEHLHKRLEKLGRTKEASDLYVTFKGMNMLLFSK